MLTKEMLIDYITSEFINSEEFNSVCADIETTLRAFEQNNAFVDEMAMEIAPSLNKFIELAVWHTMNFSNAFILFENVDLEEVEDGQ